jgi:hypothetical protein
MNVLFKFIFSLLTATFFSILLSVATCVILLFIVDLFKLNYGRDAYWVFSTSFIVLIISWIIFFFFSSQIK